MSIDFKKYLLKLIFQELFTLVTVKLDLLLIMRYRNYFFVVSYVIYFFESEILSRMR